MKKLGTVPIPENRYRHDANRAQKARQMINDLKPGSADLYEFADKKEAHDYRSMLYSMAILKFGEAGHLAISQAENTLYLWLVDPNRKED